VSKEQIKSAIVGFTILFIFPVIFFSFLKLTGIVGWSWVWIFGPLWIPFLFVTITLYLLFIVIVAKLTQKQLKENRTK